MVASIEIGLALRTGNKPVLMGGLNQIILAHLFWKLVSEIRTERTPTMFVGLYKRDCCRIRASPTELLSSNLHL
jgi:hypothetical protein